MPQTFACGAGPPGAYALAVCITAFLFLSASNPVLAALVGPITQTSFGADGEDGVLLSKDGTDGDPGGLAHATLLGADTLLTHTINAVFVQSRGGRGGNGEIPLAGGLGGHGGHGGGGGTVSAQIDGIIDAISANGVVAHSRGGIGGMGARGDGATAFGGDGGRGGSGGGVAVNGSGSIQTTGSNRTGLSARSSGGDGGDGGGADGIGGVGGLGRIGGAGGGTTVDVALRITTHGDDADGIFAQSEGARGGRGGTGVGGGGRGGAGGTGGSAGTLVRVVSRSSVTTHGDRARGIVAWSRAQDGGDGGNGTGLGGDGGHGGLGGSGRAVSVENSGTITTTGSRAIGIVATSSGGDGGAGGTGSGLTGAGGDGGPGGAAGAVTILNAGEITTAGSYAHGIVARSLAGAGGAGGLGAGLTGIGGSAAGSANSGAVTVTNNGTITVAGRSARGIYAQSIGGFAGTGGEGSGLLLDGYGGSSDSAGDGNSVTVMNAGTVTTRGGAGENLFQDAIFAQSVGGGGGDGGDASGLLATIGGAGSAGGDGGTVLVESHDSALTTGGARARGIFAQSVGGGGGNAGDSATVGAWGGFALGGSGGPGGKGGAVDVITDAMAIKTRGEGAHGIAAYSTGGGGGSGAYAVTLTGGLLASLSVAVGGGGGAGGDGGSVDVRSHWTDIDTQGDDALGIHAESVGGGGGSGRAGVAAGFSDGVGIAVGYGGRGGDGGDGQAVTVSASGTIVTAGARSSALLAASTGGGGGNGGVAIALGGGAVGGIGLTMGGLAGDGGDAGTVTVEHQLSRVETSGDESPGMAAVSTGGGGGWAKLSLALGGGGTFNLSGNLDSLIGSAGGDGGDGGEVSIAQVEAMTGSITTHGRESHGLYAHSQGGGGGFGGVDITGGGAGTVSVNANVGSILGSEAGGGGSGKTATVNVDHATIVTSGAEAHGLMALSQGGGGGFGGVNITGGGAGVFTMAGNVNSLLGSSGGDGGQGGRAELSGSHNTITTRDEQAHAVLAQSLGGGGGMGSVNIAGGGAGTASVTGNIGSLLGSGGGTGGNADTVRLDLDALTASTRGDRAYGVVAQSTGGGGGFGGVNVAGGGAGTVNVSGNIDSLLGSSGGMGGHGGKVDAALTDAQVSIGTFDDRVEEAFGILAHSLGGGGGVSSVNIAGGGAGTVNVSGNLSHVLGSSGGAGGSADRVALTLINPGVETFGASTVAVVAQSTGGGGGFGGLNVAGGGAGTVNVSTNISSVLGSTAGSGGDAGEVNLQSLAGGSITTHGKDGIGVLAHSQGGGGGVGAVHVSGGGAGTVNVTTNLSSVLGGSGGSGGDADRVELQIEGLDVDTSGKSAYGIVARSAGGGGGFGGVSITGGGAGTVNVSSNISSVFGSSSATGGDAGEVDVQVRAGSVTTRSIADESSDLPYRAHGVLAQSAGGGGGIGSVDITGGGSGRVNVTGNVSSVLGSTLSTGGAGKSVTLDSADMRIATFGSHSFGLAAQSLGGGGGFGGVGISGGGARSVNFSGNITSFLGSSGGSGGSADTVALYSSGDVIETHGDESHGLFAHSQGGGGGVGAINLSGGGAGKLATTLNVGGDGGAGGTAAAVTLKACALDDDKTCQAAGTAATTSIHTRGEGAHGIAAQSIGGGGGLGGIAIAMDLAITAGVSAIGASVGGNGGTGETAGDVTVISGATIVTDGDEAKGLFVQSAGGGGGRGGVAFKGALDWGQDVATTVDLALAIGGHGGSGNHAGDLVGVETLHGSRIITSGRRAHGIHAQSIGGGGGDGGLAVGVLLDNAAQANSAREVNVALGVGGFGGSGATGEAIEIAARGDIYTAGAGAHGLYAQSIGGGGGAGGGAVAGALVANSNTPSTKWSVDLTLGGFGGDGNRAGAVTITNGGRITTAGTGALGILAESIGGGGGDGGNANAFAFALGLRCHVPLVSGVVCPAGRLPGGADLPVYTFKGAIGGIGGSGADGGRVDVTNDHAIRTHGLYAPGIQAQSIGLGGGNGGNAATSLSGVFPSPGGFDLVDTVATLVGVTVDNAKLTRKASFTVGGKGGGSGDGGDVVVTNNASIATTAVDVEFATVVPFLEEAWDPGTERIDFVVPASAPAIVAQSIGGGGGVGGVANAGLTGTISVGGFGGASGDAGKVDVSNHGALRTAGGDSFGIFAQSIGGGGGLSEFQLADPEAPPPGSGGACGGIICLGGFGGAQGDGGTVDIVNSGSILTAGKGARAIHAQSIGGGGGAIAGGTKTTFGLTLMPRGLAFGGIGGAGGDGAEVAVANQGEITTLGESAEAIFAQSVGGGGGSSKAALALVAIGGVGGSSGAGGMVTVANHAALATYGRYSSAIAAQSIGGGGGDQQQSTEQSYGGSGGDAIGLVFALGGKPGSVGSGGTVRVDNFADATIRTWGEQAHGIFAQSIGGGGGTSGNSWAVILPVKVSLGLGGGAGGRGDSVTVSNAGAVTTHGNAANAIVAQSIGGGGGLGGSSFAGPITAYAFALGGDGGSGGHGGPVQVDNLHGAALTINGANATAIFAQSIGGGGGHASTTTVFPWTIAGALGGSGGSAGDGSDVHVTNAGTVTTNGANAVGIMAQSVGGGGGVVKALANDLVEPVEGLTRVGGADGAHGAGGEVLVNNTGTIRVNGANSIGIFAQSVGGGGGLAQITGGAGELRAANGNAGDGAKARVINTGDIIVSGRNSVGIAGQSIGGGGGLVQSVASASASGAIRAGSSGGAGRAAPIVINQTGHVIAAGDGATALLVQSDARDGRGDIEVNILNRSPATPSVIAGGRADGAAVRILGGAHNRLVNHGHIINELGVLGNAIRAAGGSTHVSNYGTVAGAVALGSARGTFDNEHGSAFLTGRTVALGGGVLTNHGDLAPGGAGTVQQTTVAGSLVQTGRGIYHVDLDLAGVTADRVDVSGAVELDGHAELNVLNAGRVRTGSHTVTVVSSAAGLDDAGLRLRAPQSAVADFRLNFVRATELVLHYSVDFAAVGGLNANQVAMGSHLNAALSRGDATGLAPLADALFALPDGASVGSVYDQLSPEALLPVAAAAQFSSLQFGDAMLSCRSRSGGFRFVSEGECAWMAIGGSTQTRERTARNLGSERDALSLGGGLQRAFGEDWRIGFALGFEHNRTRTGRSSEVEGDQVQAGIIFKRRMGAHAVAAAFSGGYGWFDGARAITAPLAATTARSEPRLGFFATRLRASRDLQFGHAYLRPLIDAAVTHVHSAGYSETGAGALNLEVRSRGETHVMINPAIELGGEWGNANHRLLRPYLRGGWMHMLSANAPRLTARFEGTPEGVEPFTVRDSGERDFAEVAVGLDVLGAHGLDIRIEYSGTFSGRTRFHAGHVKFAIPF